MRSSTLAVALVTGLSLAACSSGTTGITTGSILGGSPAQQVSGPAVAPQRPEDRAFQVATIVARAERCGYNFDPQRLRDGYFAYEAAGGLGADQVASVNKVYETTYRTVGRTISSPDEFCNDSNTRAIKADLTRYLAGDYSLPQRAVASSGGGWFDSSGPRKREVLDPEWMRDQQNNSRTKRVE